jgi:hypothetical protein
MAGSMMLYTKNGSIPQPETDGTEGWIPAPDKPDCPEGKQVVWLNWEWVVRDPKPEDRPGYQWNWNHSEKAWVEGAWPATAETIEITEVSAGTTSISGTETVIGSTGADSITITE